MSLLPYEGVTKGEKERFITLARHIKWKTYVSTRIFVDYSRPQHLAVACQPPTFLCDENGIIFMHLGNENSSDKILGNLQLYYDHISQHIIMII